MERNIRFCLIFLGLFTACEHVKSEENRSGTAEVSSNNQAQVEIVDPQGSSIASRFKPPEGYRRTSIDAASFADYLRKLPLKEVGSMVTYFDGTTKPDRNVYEAVVDLPIGKHDLHQCADAVMRLRAEYLFKVHQYDRILFNFTNGFKADYSNWRKGKRIAVNGNKVSWYDVGQPSDTYETFWKYLEMVFSYAGTASLEKEMKSVSLENMRIGDVFIQGGFPGHAVIIVDMAIHTKTKEKLFLLAQSYMPAQEIQILKNPNDEIRSPWYSSEIYGELRTPEWTFKKTQLRRF